MRLTQIQTEKLSLVYMLCAGIKTFDELTDEEKLRYAVSTKRYINKSQNDLECWSPDWLGMGLKLGRKEYDIAWKAVAEHVRKAPVTQRSLPGKSYATNKTSFAPLTIELMDYVVDSETPHQNVYNIYESTGKIVHSQYLLDGVKDPNTDLTNDKIVIEKARKLKLTLTEMSKVQEYLNRAALAKVKTKFKWATTALPTYLMDLQAELSRKNVKIYTSFDLEKGKREHSISFLGLLGYRLCEFEKVSDGSGDFAFAKADSIYEDEEVKDLLEQDSYNDTLFGLATIKSKVDNRPVQHFRNTAELYFPFTPKYYNESIVEQFKEHRDTIIKYLEVPKRYYLSRKSIRSPIEWDIEAIALDIYHEEGIAIHPDVFKRITSKFQGKSPMEWLSEI